jgi:hypothetical protein
MAQENLPEIGFNVIHRPDFSNGTGPVWTVTSYVSNQEGGGKLIRLELAKHSLNVGLACPPREISSKAFHKNYHSLSSLKKDRVH